MTAYPLQVYLAPRKGRARMLYGRYIEDKKWPSTIEAEGRTWYWVGADLSNRTITYAETLPPPPV